MTGTGDVRSERPITATHLYDFAVCEHRVALDFTLDRSRRAPPDEALRLLLERGRTHESEIAATLGYAAVAPRPDDPRAAFAETVELMRRGVPGIYQGILIAGRCLAIPDLLKREEGSSDLGGHHYVPGDIKSGFEPRTDQALQVVFAARLLEAVQGRLPASGFLLLGDGSEEAFEIDDVVDSAGLALASVEEIAEGRRETFPFLSESCARCRWREACLPLLQEGPDLSFIAGMTRTRKRLLIRHGVRTAGDLAALDAKAMEILVSRGAPSEGLLRLHKQAKALTTRIPVRTGRKNRLEPLPHGARGQFLVAEWDPLSGGEPFLFGWATCSSSGAPFVGGEVRLDRPDAATGGRGVGGEIRAARGDAAPSGPGVGGEIRAARGDAAPGVRCEVRIAGDDSARASLLAEIVAWLGEGVQPIYHFGSSAPRAFDRIADRAGLDPALQGRIEARFTDLAPLVRARAYLPVRRYRFEEVLSAVSGQPLPPLDEPEDAPFVWFENLRLDAPGDWQGKLRARAERQLEGLVSLRDWIEVEAARGIGMET